MEEIFILDDSNDDSLLTPIPLNRNFTKDENVEQKENLNNQINEATHRSLLRSLDSSIAVIDVSDDDDDDDLEIELKSNRIVLSASSKGENYENNIPELKSSNIEVEKEQNNADDIIFVRNNYEKNDDILDHFTRIKPFSSANNDDCLTENIFVENKSNQNDDEWIEFQDDPIDLLHSTPMIARKKMRLNRKTPMKHGKKLLLSSKKTQLKSSNCLRNEYPSNQNKSIRISKKLFDLDPLVVNSVQTITSKKSQNLQKKDAIAHIKILIESGLFQLAAQQFTELFAEKKIRYEIVNEENPNDCDANKYFCCTWECQPRLKNLIREVNCEQNHFFYRTNIHQESSLFDHLLLLTQCPSLHNFLDHYLNFSIDNDLDKCENKLFETIAQICESKKVYNVTLVIFKLEHYLKLQQKRLDQLFKNKINNLMLESQMTEGNIRKNKRTNTKSSSLHEHEMTAENLDLLLIDCKNRFLHRFDEKDRRCKLSTINIDTENELAMLLFRYSRSLSEQIFRTTIKGRSHLDFYIQTDRFSTIDPKDPENFRTLWRQQLLQFPNITHDVAELIANVFPSPRILYQKLIESSNPIEMIANLKPGNESTRRIGTELAHKINLFMTTTNADIVLKTN